MTAPLRVTVVSDARTVWGAERSVLALAPHLAAYGVTTTLASPPGEFADAARDLGIAHVPLTLPPRGWPERTRRAARVREALGIPTTVREIARATRDADLVHSVSLLVHPDVAIAGRLTRTPTLVELHDIVDDPAARAMLSIASASAAATVSISRATSDCVRGPGRRRLRLLPQGIDTARFTPGPADPAVRSELGGVPGELLVGILGRVDPEKGVHRLIEAAARAQRVRVAVIGAPGIDSGGYLDAMRELGARLLGDRVRFLGLRTDTDTVLRSLDVLVNASDAEPFGLSVLEAQGCGTAVLTARTGGLPDFVEHGRTGLLVDATDPGAMADALDELRDPGLRTRLGAAAAANVAAHHSTAARARSLEAVYRDCVGRRSVRGVGTGA